MLISLLVMRGGCCCQDGGGEGSEERCEEWLEFKKVHFNLKSCDIFLSLKGTYCLFHMNLPNKKIQLNLELTVKNGITQLILYGLA